MFPFQEILAELILSALKFSHIDFHGSSVRELLEEFFAGQN